MVSESDLMCYPLKQFNAFVQDSGLADSQYVEYTRFLREMWHKPNFLKDRLPDFTCELGCGRLKEFRQLLQNACLTPNGVRFLEEERERFMNRRQQHNSRQRRKERVRDGTESPVLSDSLALLSATPLRPGQSSGSAAVAAVIAAHGNGGMMSGGRGVGGMSAGAMGSAVGGNGDARMSIASSYGPPSQYTGSYPAYVMPQLSSSDMMRAGTVSGSAPLQPMRLSPATHFPYTQAWQQQGAVPMVMNPTQQQYMLSSLIANGGSGGGRAGSRGIAGGASGMMNGETAELDAARNLTSLNALSTHHLGGAMGGASWNKQQQQQQQQQQLSFQTHDPRMGSIGYAHEEGDEGD